MNTSTIPQTDSIAELATFWSTHDLTDFEDELEEVTETVFERADQATLHVRLQPHELERIKLLAEAQGVEEAALVREWVLEKLELN